MPPEDAKKQPTDEERKKFLDWIPKVKYLNPKDPGAFVIRRLNKVEYGNTLRDLLDVDPSVAKDLPDEVPGEGYLNNLSPVQTEQYLVIANQALNLALGPQTPRRIRQLRCIDRVFAEARMHFFAGFGHGVHAQIKVRAFQHRAHLGGEVRPKIPAQAFFVHRRNFKRYQFRGLCQVNRQ